MSMLASQLSKRLFSAALIVLLAACSGESGSTADADTGATNDVAADTGTTDAGTDTTQIDTAVADTAETEDAGFQLECPGGPGCPCAENADCDNNFCIETLQGRTCAIGCVQTCPDEAGFACTGVDSPGGDIVTICVPRYGFLCDPCLSSTDCSMLGQTGKESGCFRMPLQDGADAPDEGAFCTVSCSADADCPAGYGCESATSTEGESRKVCRPKDDGGATVACNCSARAATKQLSTSCEAKSELGVCPGTRSCSEAGKVSTCAAAAATKEACDGVDNDCNGVTDEGLCDDGDICTDDSCDGDKGACVNTPNTAPCDDTNACTSDDVCGDTGCKGTPVGVGPGSACDDANPCTDDSCTPADGCQHKPHNKPCDDGSACTNNDLCDGKGACVGLALDVSAVCNDDNPCTADGCDKATGCTNKATAGTCEDGNPCTNGDTCQSGVCAPGNNVCACQTDTDCKASEDDNLCNGTLYCDKSAAPFVCKVDPKTVVSCDSSGDGTCSQTVCEAATGKCGAKAAVDGKPCDADGSVCTTGDACKAGSCAPGTKLDCDDSNPCTDDGCDPKKGCDPVFNIGPCSDDDACTKGDTCASGQCIPGKKVDCNDDNECTLDYCDKSKGDCVHNGDPYENDPCDADGSVCTKGDACVGGTCTAGKALPCNDDNACTSDSCDKVSGCKYLDNTEPCDADGNACTVGDACKNGSCVKGGDKDCNDANVCTVDACDNKTGNCTHVAEQQDGTPCDADGTACTDADACKGTTCVAGKKLECDDGSVCTNDSCHPKSGCVHENIDGSKCDDGDACTKSDLCVAGKCKGLQLDCEDNNPCTQDVCAADAGCKHPPVSDGTSCGTSTYCVSGACVTPSCGDGYAAGAEQCDDGNKNACDGCESCARRGQLAFDGKSSAGVVTSTPGPDGKLGALTLLGDLTIEFWVRADKLGAAQVLLARADAKSVNVPYLIGLTAQGVPYFQAASGGGTETITASQGGKAVALVQGKWAHVAVSVAGKSVRLFVDGKASGQSTLTYPRIDALGGGLTVGAKWKGDTTSAFTGRIDALHIAAAALRGGDFVPGREPRLDPLTLGYWRMDDASDAKVAADAGLLGLDLVLAGATFTADDCYGAAADAGVCGDGKVAPLLEACDDGDTKACDGCEACQLERNLDHTGVGVLATEGFPKWASDSVCTSCRMTIEAWVRPDKTDGVYEIAGTSCGFASLFLAQAPGGGTYFGIVRFPLPPVFGTTIVKPGKWYHVAGAFGWGANEPMRIWVDGQLEGSAVTQSGSNIPGYEIDKEVLFLGAGTGGTNGGCVYNNETPTSGTPFPGRIDEIRVSHGLRYEDAFTPRRRLLADADTRGLWRFDGPGGIAADDSGRGTVAVSTKSTAVADACYGDLAGAASCGDGQQARWESCDNGVANGAWPKKCSPTCTATSEPDCTSVGWQAASVGDGKNAMTYDASGWTVEGWVRLADLPSSGYGVIAGVEEPGASAGCASMPQGQAWRVAVAAGGVDASKVGGATEKSSTATPVWQKGVWQHFALQYHKGGIGSLYVDGRLARSFSAVGEAWSTSCALKLGDAYVQGKHPIGAELASLRLSKGARYGETFLPADTLNPDKRTIWLFDFAEKSGSVATDLVTGYKITLDNPSFSSGKGPSCTP
ncbi:MAG: DUF4215 domain-containing protein [Deltaproteobacteria bacterium]|nr:DUF4215 domain-containing protein [Deltaproteobacteria bacterium]